MAHHLSGEPPDNTDTLRTRLGYGSDKPGAATDTTDSPDSPDIVDKSQMLIMLVIVGIK